MGSKLKEGDVVAFASERHVTWTVEEIRADGTASLRSSNGEPLIIPIKELRRKAIAKRELPTLHLGYQSAADLGIEGNPFITTEKSILSNDKGNSK